MIIPNIWENKKCSKPPTSIIIHVYIYIPIASFHTDNPSQPMGDNQLWPCPLRVESNSVCHSYVYIYIHTYIYIYHVYIEMYKHTVSLASRTGTKNYPNGELLTFPSPPGRPDSKVGVASRWIAGPSCRSCHWIWVLWVKMLETWWTSRYIKIAGKWM